MIRRVIEQMGTSIDWYYDDAIGFEEWTVDGEGMELRQIIIMSLIH